MELLVVVAVIALLAGLILAVIPLVRDGANRTLCASNLRQHGMAIIAETQENQGIVRAVVRTNDTSGWYPYLMWLNSTPETENELTMSTYLTYMDNTAIIDFAVTTSGTYEVVGTGTSVFRCPGRPTREIQVFAMGRALTLNNPLVSWTYSFYGRTETLLPGFVSDSTRLTQQRLDPNRLLMSDTVNRWHVSGDWYPNHGTLGAQTVLGGPLLKGANQLNGDGSVRWKSAGEFNFSALGAGWAAAPAMWSDAVGSDGNFF